MSALERVLSPYVPNVGDVVARRDRNLGEWGLGQRGYAAYDVLKVSPGGQRVTIRPVGNPAAPAAAPRYLTTGREVRGLVPMTADIEAEIRQDDAWLTARRTAQALSDWLRAWTREQKCPEEVDRFLNTVEPLRAMMERGRNEG